MITLAGRAADPHWLYLYGSLHGLIERWKPDISVVKATIEFAKETGRLHLSVQDAESIEADINKRRLLRISLLII